MSKSYSYDSNPASTSDYSYSYNTTYEYDTWASLGGDNYYRAPWEITADMLGGVSRKIHTKEDVTRGWWYLGVAIGFFPACYLFL